MNVTTASLLSNKIKIILNSESLSFVTNAVVSFKRTGEGVDEQSHGQQGEQL